MSIPQRSCFLCRYDYGLDMGISAFKQIKQTAFGPLQSGKECVCMCMWEGLWTGGLLSITQYHFSLRPSCNYTQQLDRLIVLQHLTSKKKKKIKEQNGGICHIAKFFSKQDGKGKRDRREELSGWFQPEQSTDAGNDDGLRWLLLPRSGGICSAGTNRSVYTIGCNTQKWQM